MFRNLKIHDAHVIMREPGKLDFEENVKPSGLETHMSFSIDNKPLLIVSKF